MTNIVDAVYLERVHELRLISSIKFKNEPIVFSVTAQTLNEAHDILDVLGVTIPKLDAQLIDAGTHL